METEVRKRGRKPKQKTEDTSIVKLPKKRGRKPKTHTEQSKEQTNLTGPLNSIITKPILIKLKIGRADTIRIDQQINQFTHETDHRPITVTAFNQEQSEQQFAPIKKTVTTHSTENNETLVCVEKEKISTLPSIYEKGVWPEKTNIKCWWCTLSFDTIPCFIPKKMRAGKYHVVGCFCSFNCAMAYNLYSLDQNQHDCLRQCSLLHTLYTEIHDDIREILPSPPKEIMIMYGGKLSIDQYRKKINECNIQSYKINYPPIVGINFELEHLSKTGSVLSSKTYVLERSKPPPNERKKLTRKFIKIVTE
jgi:hypothetical protein